jgi:hypothetical protein
MKKDLESPVRIIMNPTMEDKTVTDIKKIGRLHVVLVSQLSIVGVVSTGFLAWTRNRNLALS